MLALRGLSILATIVDASAITRVSSLRPRDTGSAWPDTVGYQGIFTEGTVTLYVARTCPSGLTWYASGEITKYGGCCSGSSCSRVATACSNGYKLYSGVNLSTSSSLCSSSCYQDVILQSLGDTETPTIQYVCGTESAGATLYRTWPTEIPASSTIDNNNITFQAAASSTAARSASMPSSPTPSSPTRTSTPAPSSVAPSGPPAFTPIIKSSLAAPIAGGVAGGCGLLAIVVIVAIWFTSRRRASRGVKESNSAPYSRHRDPKPPSRKLGHNAPIGLNRLG